MLDHSATRPGERQERRKERTRAALVAAAQGLMVEGRDLQASIQTITDRADVGFGSFYNHFATKDELFEAAVSAALDDYLGWLDERLGDVSDPVVRLFESIRYTGRLALERPRTAQVLGRRHVLPDRGDLVLGERMRGDVIAAMASRDVRSDSVELGTLMVAALGAIQAVAGRAAELTEDEVVGAADALAHAVLRILRLDESGVPASPDV